MMPEEGFLMKRDAWITVKMGYEWDDLFDRNLSLKQHKTQLSKKVKKYAAMGNFASFTLGCNDRVELYGTVGAEKAHIDYQPYSDTQINLKTDHHFAWTIGGRAILAYWGYTQLGIDAKYFEFNPSIDSLKVNENSVQPQGAFYNYQEWQVGLGVSHQFNAVIPYIGLKYSNVSLKFHRLNALNAIASDKQFNMKNKHSMGIFLGLGFSFKKALNLNFEARFYDETAITASGDIRF
jgi:hypothetical protein